MRALIRGTALMLVVACHAMRAAPVLAQTDPPLFRAVVDVVTLDVFAHRQRQPIAGLTARDFIVRDNGVEQQVASVHTTDSAHVIMGLDMSGSVDGATLEQLRAAVSTVAGALTNEDRVSLFTFDDRIRLLARVEVPSPRLEQIVRDRRPGGSTTLLDALVFGAALSRADSRPAVFVLFTDGMDTASWNTPTRTIDALRNVDVVVYPVGAGLPSALVSSDRSDYFTRATWLSPLPADTLRLLQMVADTTGGEFLRVNRQARLAETFAAILRQYRQRYLLSFSPTGVGTGDGWHRLEVRLRTRQGAVVAREGYMARTDSGGPARK